jgi:hypothetical protein
MKAAFIPDLNADLVSCLRKRDLHMINLKRARLFLKVSSMALKMKNISSFIEPFVRTTPAILPFSLVTTQEISAVFTKPL